MRFRTSRGIRSPVIDVEFSECLLARDGEIAKTERFFSQCLPSREHDRIAAQLRNTESAHCV